MMQDLISRQAAIRKYQEVCNGIKCGECPFLIKVNTEKGSHLITDCKLEAFLHNLPSAQPTQTDTSNTLKALDCVERQAAIDAIFSEPLYESGMKKRDADAVVPAIYEKIKSLQPAQPEPYLDSIVSEIEKTISETRESGKHHDINVRANGDLICYGLQLALEIIEEKRNERFDIQAIGD